MAHYLLFRMFRFLQPYSSPYQARRGTVGLRDFGEFQVWVQRTPTPLQVIKDMSTLVAVEIPNHMSRSQRNNHSGHHLHSLIYRYTHFFSLQTLENQTYSIWPVITILRSWFCPICYRAWSQSHIALENKTIWDGYSTVLEIDHLQINRLLRNKRLMTFE